MIISQLKVQNFRCHQAYQLNIKSQKLAIIGHNGVGKTSLLEAIYLLSQGKSFKDSDIDLIKQNQSWARIDGIILTQNTHQRTIKLQQDNTKNIKIIEINQKKYHRLPQNYKIPVVVFEPDELNLIIGSPTRRRRYLDLLISQIVPVYSRLLSRYTKTLKQRNDLIKQMLDYGQISQEQLFSWNVLLSQYGGQIIKYRLEITNQLNQLINQFYQQITGVNDDIKFKYQFESGAINFLEQKIFNELSNQRNFYQGTVVGPHRHDLEIYFNQKMANKCASRGETRSIILAMKLIEIEIIKQRLRLNPLVLLDDVMSELDHQRQLALMQFTNQSQIILTSTEVKNLTDYQIEQL
ncbi:MAG: DNA replication and repair protein RecF [Candidatus Saccharibacteria bacterium]|nr:DNA replication and repair protein RecF [Candidatus Saccharibacteria bacterium]